MGRGQIPMVIVEGFLGGAGAQLWGMFETYLNNGRPASQGRPCYFVSVGPVSSLHDRACELYYAIMGGTVDYGEEHSRVCKHARYGRINDTGVYPEWSIDNPLHFLGHSLGGPTIIKLQKLLKDGHFGLQGHPSMILSVNAVSSPFRGTQLVYTLGERPDAVPRVRLWSFGAMLSRAVHILAYLSPLLPIPSILHAEHRALTYRDLSLLEFLKQLWSSDWAEGTDAAPYDVTFQAMKDRENNFEGVPHPDTYYYSIVAVMTERLDPSSYAHGPSIQHLPNLPLYLGAKAIGRFDFSTLRPVPDFVLGTSQATRLPGAKELEIADSDVEAGCGEKLNEQHFASDGIVPLFSQWHPLSCSPSHCHHQVSTSPIQILDAYISPGIWVVNEMKGSSHASIASFCSAQQQQFWIDLGERLRLVDALYKQKCLVAHK